MSDLFKREIAQTQHEIQSELGNPLLENLDGDQGHIIPEWFIHILTLFINLINSVIGYVDARFADFEEDSTDDAASEKPKQAAPKTQPHPVPPSKTRRCTKCHARGHIDSDCTTADPAAMRRRIAANQRRKKDARRSTHLIPASSSNAIPYHLMHPPFVAPQPQVNLAALAADASELRRRQTQSARDKRRARHSS